MMQAASLRTAARRFSSFAVLVTASLVLSGCAASPDIRTDYDRSVDFSSFETYGYPDELGTDRAGYSTLITQHFKQAVDREMQSRGYRYVEDDPDLLVNFFANVRDVTRLRSRPNLWVSYGYYGYRYGLYSAWPLYASGTDTVHYRVGTANIDIVDAERRQLIWEGVAEGKLTREVLEDPQPAIEAVVAELFSRFPGRAPGHAAD
ncbi:MAG TPA: DUF4136 domain-containing protein [Woeseiaceae bacterium]|nr:DUF4136 domain-containing protein [Woeseiaceae bacterium]